MTIERKAKKLFLLALQAFRKFFLPPAFAFFLSPCVANGEIPLADEKKNRWEGNAETQIGHESNIYRTDRFIEPPTASWFSASSLEWWRSWERERGSLKFILEAEYKTYFYTHSLEEYRLQPQWIWREFFSDGWVLDISCQAAVLREKVYQDLVDEPDETEEAIGAGIGFQLKKTCPDRSYRKWSGQIGGEIFEYMQGSNLSCLTEFEVGKPTGEDSIFRRGVTLEWQAYRHMDWGGQPNGEPPELNTMFCRAFAGFAGSLNENWEWKFTVTGGPDFDLKRGYYNALVCGVQARIAYRFGQWSMAAKLDAETAFFSNRPAVLETPSPALIAQELWVGSEAAYEIFSGLELFASASWDLQWTNGGHSGNAALNTYDDLIIRTGLRLEF